MNNLAGKVALVTGAGGKHGIGRATALQLAKAGADVVVTDIVAVRAGRDEWPGLPALVAEIEALGRRGLALISDVSDAAQVASMYQQTMATFGRLDILVHNAGAPAGRDRVPVVDLEEDAFDFIQSVNLKGTFLCCRGAARIMIKQGSGGRIITMSSVSGLQGVARYAAYCASKFAVRGFTQSLALELAPHHITVNALCPALIETERVDDMAAALAPETLSAAEQKERMMLEAASETPLGRVGQPEDVARTAAFLASEDAAFLTGLSVPIAGGIYMQ